MPNDRVRAFRQDGHVAVLDLLPREEIDAIAPRLIRQGLDGAWDRRPLAERDTYGQAFLQAFDLWRADPQIARFVFDPRPARLAAELLGVEGVRLYHDQALFKEPDGGPTPWHQDQYYWPLDTDRTVTVWIPLVDVPAEVGSMTFASGSHLLEDLRGPGISDESQAGFAHELVTRGLELRTHGPLARGDATFHHGWTVHSAPGNPSEMLRPVMTMIYVDASAHVAQRIEPGQEFDHAAWLGARHPVRR